MHILLIENDSSDVEFIKEILMGSTFEEMKSTPNEINGEYDLILLDYFVDSGTSQKFLRDLNLKKDFNTPIIIMSGKIDEISIGDIPKQLNSLVLSKNENFKEMLLYYIGLLCGGDLNRKEVDYKTLFLDLVHDLKNDLMYCGFYKEQREIGFDSAAEEKEVWDLILESSIFAYSRLEQLSDFLNLEVDSFKSLKESFDLISQSHYLKKYSSSITLKGETDKIISFLPAYFVSVILKNLIENSCKNASDSRELKIMIHFAEEENGYVLSVVDNAKGMPDEVKDKLFYKRQRKDGAGLGIGLVVLNRIIQSLNGKIVVRSQIDVGTTIILRFPKNE